MFSNIYSYLGLWIWLHTRRFFTNAILQRAGSGVLVIPRNVKRTLSHHTVLAMDGVSCRLFFVRTTYGATMRHMCRWFLGHYIRYWRAGNPKATMLQGISLVSLVVFCALWPGGKHHEANVWLHHANRQVRFYWLSQISKTEDSLCVCRAN